MKIDFVKENFYIEENYNSKKLITKSYIKILVSK